MDTHIFRVANRTGLAPGKNVREVEDKLLEFTPDEYKQDAHHWLILHGRYVCKARKPERWSGYRRTCASTATRRRVRMTSRYRYPAGGNPSDARIISPKSLDRLFIIMVFYLLVN